MDGFQKTCQIILNFEFLILSKLTFFFSYLIVRHSSRVVELAEIGVTVFGDYDLGAVVSDLEPIQDFPESPRYDLKQQNIPSYTTRKE